MCTLKRLSSTVKSLSLEGQHSSLVSDGASGDFIDRLNNSSLQMSVSFSP